MFLVQVVNNQSWLDVLADGVSQGLQFLGNLINSLFHMLQLAVHSISFSAALSGFFPSILGTAILFTVAIYVVKLIVGR